MYHKMYELRDMLMDELDRCVNKGELSPNSLEYVDKITHSIKSIDTILAMAGYTHDDDYSGARGRRYARRDSMGRYSRGYDDGHSYRGYSRDKHELIKELHDLEMDAQDEETKHMIRKFIKQAEENE